MFGNVTAAQVRLKITSGNEKCETEQKSISDAAKKLANAKRLAVRQEWAAEDKDLKALLAVVERNEPKEDTE